MATELESLKLLVSPTNLSDEELTQYLEIATDKILNRLYPFGRPEGVEDIPTRYRSNKLNIACYLANKRGAEGETSHSENGVARTYSSADVPAELLDDIIPLAKIGDGYAVS